MPKYADDQCLAQRKAALGAGKAASSPFLRTDYDPQIYRSVSGSLDQLDPRENNGFRASAPSRHDSPTPIYPRHFEDPGLPPPVPVTRSTSSFIPTGNGDKPLNLDVAKFIQVRLALPPTILSHQTVLKLSSQSTQRRNPLPMQPSSPGAPPPTTDSDIIDALLFRHTSIASILHSRLTSIRLIRQAWDESNIKQAIETMVNLKDSAVCIDILRIINLKPKLLTLDAAIVLLPALNELLFEVYEE